MIITRINTEEGYKILINIFFNSGKLYSTNRHHLYSLEVKSRLTKAKSEKWLINPPEWREQLYDHTYSFKGWRYCIDYHENIAIIKNNTNNFNIIASTYVYYPNEKSEFYSKSIINNHQTHCLEILSYH